MQQTGKKNIKKSYIVLTFFTMFWLLTFAYLFAENKLNKKTPNISWAYHQLFPQSWNFFSQPAIYNDKLIFILKNKNQSKLDSVDVLDILWSEKRTKFNYARANVWDHIMFRQIRYLRTELTNKTLVAYNETDNAKMANYYITANAINNKKLLDNFEVFGKEMLRNKQFKVDSSTQYQMLLVTDYTKPFNKKDTITKNDLAFKTDWKTFANATH